MNSLINTEFFQQILNTFIIEDVDIIPWKLTCISCYEYRHNIYLSKFIYKYGTNISKQINIIKVDLSKHIYVEDNVYNNCCNQFFLAPNFDINIFKAMKNTTSLKLLFVFDYVRNIHISGLYNLKKLDLGMYNYITDNAIITLINLEELYLRNNNNVTKKIFSSLKKLHTIQIPDDSKINISDIPKHISTIIINTYDVICEKCDTYEFEVSSNIYLQ